MTARGVEVAAVCEALRSKSAVYENQKPFTGQRVLRRLDFDVKQPMADPLQLGFSDYEEIHANIRTGRQRCMV